MIYNHQPFLKNITTWICSVVLIFSSFSVFAADPVNTIPGTISTSRSIPLKITTGLSVNDADGDPLEVTLVVNNGGELFLGTTSGLAFIDNDGTDGVLVFQGSLVDLNNALADLTVLNETAASSSSFQILSDDTGTTDFDNFTINWDDDNSLAFQGDDDRLTITNGGTFFNSGTFTYEAWVLIEDDGSPQWSIFELSIATTNLIYINNSGQIVAADTNGDEITSSVDSYPIDGNWHHVAIVDDGSSGELIYVDGVAVGIDTDNFTNFNTAANSSAILVGDRAAIGGYEFSGKIDELRIWSVGRTALEISNNIDHALVGNEFGLEAYYKLDQGVAGGPNGGVTVATNSDDSGGTFDASLGGFTLNGNISNWMFGQNYYPSTTTDPASSILSISAVLGGNITDQGGNVITGRGVVYAETATNGLPIVGGTGVMQEPEGGAATGSFSDNVMGLTLATNYTFRAYAENEAGIVYGDTQTFMTSSLTVPTVTTTAPATGLTSVSAIVAGEITSDGGAAITERGFVYAITSQDADPLIGNTNTLQIDEGGIAVSTFNSSLTGLIPGETYSFKAYAINGQGTSYGSVEQFTLADTPTLVPGDLAFTMTNGDAASAFSVVALTTIPAGTEIHFTDKGYDVDISDFFTSEGVITFTSGASPIFSGDQILIDPNGAGTAVLKSGGSAGSIVQVGTFMVAAAGDNIFAFQGVVNSNTDYAIGGFITGILTDFETVGPGMNGITDWTDTADDDNDSELPTSLTNGTDAISLFPAGGNSSPFHRYDFSTIVGLAPIVRPAVNNVANWSLNLGGVSTIGDLAVFDINSPPILTLDAGPAAYTENDPEIQISPTSTVVDNEGDFDGGSIEVQITNNADANDRLQVSAVGAVDFVGLNVRVSAVNVGTVASLTQTGSNSLIISLNASAGASDVQEIVRAISFDNSGDDPGTDLRTVTFNVTDGSLAMDSQTIDIAVTAVNDSPTLTSLANPIETTNEDTEVEISLSDLLTGSDAADPEGALDAAKVKVLSSGTLNLGATSGTATPFAVSTNDIIDAGTNGYWTPDSHINGPTVNAFEIVVVDDLAAESTPPVQAQVNVSAVDDEPTLTANADNPTHTEDGGAVSLFNSSTVSTIEAGQDITEFVIFISNVIDGTGPGQDELLGFDGETFNLTNGNLNVTTNNSIGYSVEQSVSGATVTFLSNVNETIFEGLIDAMTYENISQDPSTNPRVVSFVSITDSGAAGLPHDNINDVLALSSTVTIVPVNDEPTLTVLELDPTWTEDAGGVFPFSNSLASTIEAGQTFTGFELFVSNVADGSTPGQDEVLVIDGGTSITLEDLNSAGPSANGLSFNVSRSVAGATVTASGGSLTELQLETIIDGMFYDNNNEDPTGASRVISIQNIKDSGGSGGGDDDTNDALSISSTITVVSLNDAPTLTGTAVMSNIDEDLATAGNSGTLISSIITSFAGNYADAESGDGQGLAVTAVDNTNGTWEYTTDGSVWNSLSGVMPISAVVLASDGDNAIRFDPDPDFNGTVSIIVQAWDQTSADTDGDSGVDVNTSNGGSTAFSSGTGTVSITVDPVNDQPSFAVAGNQVNTSSEGAVTVLNFLPSGSLGATDEEPGSGAPTEQSVLALNLLTNTTPALFDVAPAIDANSFTLTYTIAANAQGTSTIGFEAVDSGGTVNGGTDTSAEVQFTIAVTDDQAPGINAAPPLATGPDTQTQINFTVNLNENATIFYLVREIAAAPSKADILSGTADASDITGSFSYTTPGVDDQEIISTLTQNVTYYVHWYAEDGLGNETAIVDEGNVTTALDVDAPDFDGITGVSNITATTFDIDVDLDDAGTAFYIVVLDDGMMPNALSPTVQQVIDGVDGLGGIPVASGAIGIASASSPQSVTIEFLESNTTYDVFLVAQDANENRSALREEANITTQNAANQSGDDVRVTPPTALSLCLGDDFVPLGEVRLQEANTSNGEEGFVDEDAERTLIFTLPPELEFNTSATVLLSDDGGNDDWAPEINTVVPVITTNTLSIAYTVEYDAMGNSPDRDELNINGLEVKAVESFAGTKSLLRTGGTAQIVGIVAGDGTVFADFSVASASAVPGDLTVTYCTGDAVDPTDFTTDDPDYTWYSDFTLTTVQHTGSLSADPTTLQTQLGFDVNIAATTTLYVTNTGSGECESGAGVVNIVINPSPTSAAGFDKDVCAGEELFVGGFPSLETPTVGGTYIYEWRSEVASGLRSVDEDFEAGLGTFDASGAALVGDANLAFNSTDAVRITAVGGNNLQTNSAAGFSLRNTSAVLFFYGRAETATANGATILVYGSDDDFGANSVLMGTVTTTSTDYLQYAINIPADDMGGSTFHLRIEYDDSNGEDANFIIDELILDTGLTDAVEGVKSNPFFFPPFNTSGGGNLDYNVELTIHDPNYCTSNTSLARIVSRELVNPTLLLDPSQNSYNLTDGDIEIVETPVAPATADPSFSFTGSGISYNGDILSYVFNTVTAGEGAHELIYSRTTTYTNDPIGFSNVCSEQASINISVEDRTDFNEISSEVCLNDGDAFGDIIITPHPNLIAELDNFDDSDGIDPDLDYEIDDLRYSGGPSLWNGSDYVFNPTTAEALCGGCSSTGIEVYAQETRSFPQAMSPTIPPVITPNIPFKFSVINLNTPPSVKLDNLFNGNGFCTDSSPFQINPQVGGLLLGVADDNGTFEIKLSSDLDIAYTNGGGTGITADGLITPSELTAGNYDILYTSAIQDDPSAGGGFNGCSDIIVTSIVINAQPTIASLNTNINYATEIDPALASNVALGQDVDGNGADSYHFVICQGDQLPTIFTDFTDANNDKIQDTPIYTYRWYDEDSGSPGNPNFGSEFFPGAVTDQSIAEQFDFFGVNDPTPNTYRFYFTRQTVTGSCESVTRELIIEVIADPATQPLDVSAGFFDDTSNSRQVIEYCEGEMVGDIVVDITGLIPGDEIVWFDADFVQVATTTSAAISPTVLGLGTGIPGAGTDTPPAKAELATSGTIGYTSTPSVPSFLIGENILTYDDQAVIIYLNNVIFQVGEVVTSVEGGMGTVIGEIDLGDPVRAVFINTISGFFPENTTVTGNLGGSGQNLQFIVQRTGNAGEGEITNDDGSTLTVDLVSSGFNPGDLIYGEGSRAQAIVSGFTQEEVIVPYTFYYLRRDATELLNNEFNGCDGALTKVDIVVYPRPNAPEADAVFDDNIYACVGDITTGTTLRSPVGLNEDKIYFWYEDNITLTPFADTYNDLTDDDIDITFADVASAGTGLSTAFDFGSAGTTTYYLTQVDFADKVGGVAITPDYLGCESSLRTPVNITLFDKPLAPTLSVTDAGANSVSIAASPLPNSDVTYLVCEGDVTAGYTFAAATEYMGSNSQTFDWYTVNSTTGALETLIGTFQAGANPDPATDLGLVGVTGSRYFGITQTTDIISGEFVGCTSPQINFAVQISPTPVAPTPSISDFFLCFGEEVQLDDIDVSGVAGGDEAYWYANLADVGNDLLRLTTTVDPIGSALGLSSTTPAGDYSFYVTQATNIELGAAPSFFGCESSAIEIIVHIEPIETGPSLLTSQLDRTICEDGSFSAISVTSPTANSYQWYTDAAGMNAIGGATNASYLPVVGDFGPPEVVGGEFVADFSIYVSQFTGVSGCESTLTQVDLTVHPTPTAPNTANSPFGETYEICQNTALIPMFIVPGDIQPGDIFKWYSDPGLSNQLFEGPSFTPTSVDPTSVGTTLFYVTLTTNEDNPTGFAGCESPATVINYIVNPLPDLEIRQLDDSPIPTSICVDNGIIDLEGGELVLGVLTLANNSETFSIWAGDGVTDNLDGTASFDPVAAAGTDLISFESVTKTVFFTFTDINGCITVEQHDIVVNRLPEMSILPGRTGSGIASDEYCIDENELDLFGGPQGATGVFTWADGADNSAIDNTVGVGQAQIDLLDAFETVDPSRTSRQIDYNVRYTFTSAAGCANSTTFTIKINNTPEPEFLIQRNGSTVTASGGVDLEVCVDDVSTSSANALTERITLIDNTNVSMGTLTTGDFTATTTGVILGAAALSKNAEGEYYFYPRQALERAESENPVSFTNATFIDFVIDYSFTNDVTCTGLASASGFEKIIRVYRLPEPNIDVDNTGPNANNEYCIDHDIIGDPIRLFVSGITFDSGVGNGGTFASTPTLSASALYNAGVTGGFDEVFFDPATAYAESGANSSLGEVATFQISYSYATSDIGCANVSNVLTLNVNPIPIFNYTYEQEGRTVDNIVCVDEGTILLVSEFGEGNNATFTASNISSTTAITDNNDGTAEIDIEQLFRDAVSNGTGALSGLALTDRQISIDLNLEFTDGNTCVGNTAQTLVINNLPRPEIDVTRNDGSGSLVVGTRDGSGNLVVEFCVDDMSTSSASAAQKILISDITNQATEGAFASASFSEANYTLVGANEGLEDNGDGTAFFYPQAALAIADLILANQSETAIAFVIDMSYTNSDGCTGSTNANASGAGVLTYDNGITIIVYRSPNPTIKIDDGGPVEEIEVCIVDGNSAANMVEIFRESIEFDSDGSGGTLTGTGSYNSNFAFSTSALSLPTGIDDRVLLNSELAYQEFGNGLDPLDVEITYTYSNEKTCGDTSEKVTVKINPLPTVDFIIPDDVTTPDANEFCINADDVSLNAAALEGDGSDPNRQASVSSGAFSTQHGIIGLTAINNFQAQFNFSTAFNAVAGGDPIQEVTYTFTDADGCIGRTTKNVVINTRPVVEITTEGGCDDGPVNFEFSTVAPDPGDPVVTYSWFFDDLIPIGSSAVNTSNIANPSHAYIAGAGNYSPTLQVTNDQGCISEMVSRDIVVGEIPDVNFTVEGLCETDLITFVASPRSLTFGTIKEVIFNFGDLVSQTVDIEAIVNPSEADFTFTHDYSATMGADTYTPFLEIVTTNDCNRTFKRNLTILPVEVAPYFNDFETMTNDEEITYIKKQIVDGVRQESPTINETQIVAADGWYVDLRPLDDKEDEGPNGESAWGLLPSQFNSWQIGQLPSPGVNPDSDPLNPTNYIIDNTGNASRVWMTDLDGNYEGEESRSWVYSPCFDISTLQRPMLSFDQIYHFADSRDGVVLQYSTDGGTNWQVLGGYDATTDDATGLNWFTDQDIFGVPGEQVGNVVGWADNLNAEEGVDVAAWVSSRHKLDNIPVADRGSVIFRMALGTDGSVQSEGFAFDNFEIKDREKNALLEQFSSTNIEDSEAVSASINTILDDPTINGADIIAINYHTNFAGELDNYDDTVNPPLLLNPDPISILNEEDPSARAVFYGISDIPTSVLDGAVDLIPNAARTDVPWRSTDVARSSLADALFDIVIDPNLGTEAEVISVNVTATATMDITNPTSNTETKELAVYVAIVERDVTIPAGIAANGQTSARNVLRKMLPNGIGTRFDQAFPSGTVLTVSETWDIEKDIDASDLMVVVFIQDVDSRTIYQTVSFDVTGKISPTITGINDAINGDDYSLYPNPANQEVFVVFERTMVEVMNWSVYDQTGKVFKYGKLKPGASGFSLKTYDFPAGMYFILMNGENTKFANKKFIIEH